VVDLREGAGGLTLPPPPYFGLKKKITQGRKAGRASKNNCPPLAQGLNLPLTCIVCIYK